MTTPRDRLDVSTVPWSATAFLGGDKGRCYGAESGAVLLFAPAWTELSLAPRLQVPRKTWGWTPKAWQQASGRGSQHKSGRRPLAQEHPSPSPVGTKRACAVPRPGAGLEKVLNQGQDGGRGALVPLSLRGSIPFLEGRPSGGGVVPPRSGREKRAYLFPRVGRGKDAGAEQEVTRPQPRQNPDSPASKAPSV